MPYSQYQRVAALLVAVAACKPHPPVVYPKAEPIYYAVSFETTQRAVGGDLPRRSDILAKDAKQRLQPGVTVAFMPPDSCVTTSAAPSGATQGTTAIRMECGALLASLEAEVAKAGYSVVSWQSIKSAGAVASQERAKELGVDVLFEVNELTPNRFRTIGGLQVSNLAFMRVESPTRSAPLEVTPEVARRCAQHIEGLNTSNEKEYLSTINLKAVDVSRGRALWLYENTVVESPNLDSTSRRTYYYRADGSRPEPPEPKKDSQGHFGRVMMMVSLVGLTIAGLGTAISGSSTPIIVGGAIGVPIFGAGVAMMAVGHKKSAPDRTVPPATYAAPADVVCATQVVFDPWGGGTAGEAATPAAHSSYTFTAGASADRDLVRERIQRLTHRSTADFVAALRQVAGR